MAPGVHVPLRFLRAAIKKGFAILRNRIATAQQTAARTIIPELQPALAHSQPGKNPIERIKIGKRWFTTHHHALKQASRSSDKASKIVSAVGRITTTSPFATALRPKLGGGAFPRTASGYSLGNGGALGARYFSHTPASTAEVISQVSSAMRAFMLNGKGSMKDYRRYNGTNGKAGVRAQLAAALAENGTAPGAYVDFHMAPTFTSISRFGKQTLEQDGFMGRLSGDFDMIVSDIAAVFADLKKLATLGDLPITLAKDKEDTIRVHFAGCDKEFVELLCDEVGIQRGVVGEDDRFGFDLLMPMLDFPHITSTHRNVNASLRRERDLHWQDMLSVASNDGLDPTATNTCYTPSTSDHGYLFENSSAELGSLGPVSSSSDGQSDGIAALQRFLRECEDHQAGRRLWA